MTALETIVLTYVVNMAVSLFLMAKSAIAIVPRATRGTIARHCMSASTLHGLVGRFARSCAVGYVMIADAMLSVL